MNIRRNDQKKNLGMASMLEFPGSHITHIYFAARQLFLGNLTLARIQLRNAEKPRVQI